MALIIPPALPDDVTPIVETVQGFVETGIDRQREHADNAVATANDFIDRMGTVSEQVATIPAVDVTMRDVTATVDPYEAPTQPVEPDDLTPTLPDAPVAPVGTFEYVEVTYSSALLTALKSRLQSWLDGDSTGLDPTVEAAIWNRGRARTAATMARQAGQVVREFAARGFRKPPGVMALALQQAAQEAQAADLAQSNEIVVNQASLEQTNRHFAIEKGVMTEGQIMTYTNALAQRAFESAQFADKIAIELFAANTAIYGKQVDAEVSRIDALTKVIDARTKIFESLGKGEVSRITAQADVMKAQTDLAVAEGGLRIEAAKANVQRLIQQVTLLLEAIKAGASVSAQLAASALSGVNLSAGLHASGSASSSASMSNSVSNSATNSDSYSNSVSSSTSDSTSTVYTDDLDV